MIVWWFAAAMAVEEFHVVQRGDTLASIAAELGDPALEARLRELNDLPRGEPVIGAMLRLPDDVAAISCQPSYVISALGPGTVALPGAPDPVPLRELQPLPAGSVVCTAPQSFATLRLTASAEGRTHDDVTLMGGTCVRVRAGFQGPRRRTSTLDLAEGALTVQPGDGNGRVVITTEAGVAVGDGGDFRVAVEESAMRTEALAAAVATLAVGAQVDLEAGRGNRTRVGQAPGEPVALIAPGTPLSPPDGGELRRHDFDWTKLPIAIEYVIEVSATKRFDQLLLRATVLDPPWSPARLLLPYETPVVWWRVTGVDRLGFEGLPSAAHRVRFPPAIPVGLE